MSRHRAAPDGTAARLHLVTGASHLLRSVDRTYGLHPVEAAIDTPLHAAAGGGGRGAREIGGPDPVAGWRGGTRAIGRWLRVLGGVLWAPWLGRPLLVYGCVLLLVVCRGDCLLA